MDAPPAPLIEMGPVQQAQRIQSLDVLRGFAVLGILVMNIQSYAMIGAAYPNPTAYGDLTGTNYWIWLLSHVLADMKFITIFSMLFGAGIVLMTSRREAATGRSAGLHYRRMGLLLIFGLLHAYLLWYGDILHAYAMCGLVVYLFRRCRPSVLLILGGLSIALTFGILIFFHWSQPYWPPEQVKEMTRFWAPTEAMIAQELEVYRGGWLAQMADRAPTAFFFQTFLFITNVAWWAGGVMLIGMALFKLEIFSAKRSSTCYLLMIAAAVFVGLPAILYGAYRNFAAEWDMEYSFFLGCAYNYWASILVSLGWVGAVMLACKHGIAHWLTRRLAAVGQMAFTNYLMQSVICTTIFYGHGFGLFGKLERFEQALVVFAVCAFQIGVSPVWLRHFRFGPAEWLWRSLTYMKAQPMRLTTTG